MDDPFKYTVYESKRPSLYDAYITQMVAHLAHRYPDKDEDEIRRFVVDTVKTRVKIPEVEILRHPSPGNTIREKVPLNKHVSRDIGQNIITPSGTVYMLPTRKESFLRISLTDKLKERSMYKKIYLTATEKNDTVLANNNNLLQASTKIFANSAPGAMNSAFNILYDLPGFNAITSTARHSVKYGYAHVERVVDGNLFLPTLDDVVNYCTRLVCVQPAGLQDVLDRFGLYVPSVDDVVDYLLGSMQYYMLKAPREQAVELIAHYSPKSRAFILYAGCLKNLVVFNDQYFRQFFNVLFKTDLVIDPNDTPSLVTKAFETDLLAMITSLNYDLLGRDEKGERYNLQDAITGCPDGVRHIMAIARHMNNTLADISSLLSCFFKLDTDFGRIGDHPMMIRRAVLVSDTDSVIFSTQSMVEWYSGKVDFERSSYEINAFTVYVISRTLEHVFSRLSCGFGMIGDDIKNISMKNEFLYPVMMRTPIRKHYAGIVQMQEGKLLSRPKNDIKGLQFRSSTLSALTNKAAEIFLIELLQDVMDKGKLKAHDILSKVASFEYTVWTSIMTGDRTFLQTVTVKPEKEYADPSISSFFYYEFWQAVFVPRFDVMQLPNKCFKLPMLSAGKILKSPEFLATVSAFDTTIHNNLLSFMEQNPKKQISHILVPPTVGDIPALLRPLIDVRSIIYQNCTPFYLGLASLGFGYSFSKGQLLVSDFFNPFNITVPHNS